MHLGLLMVGALPFTAMQSMPGVGGGGGAGIAASLRAGLCPLWRGDSPEDIKSAAASLRKGFPVAFPTETVYGLGAIATDDDAVARVFAAKGRPSDNPLILHVADGEAGLRRMALDGQVPEVAQRLAKAFWPGPLSICIKANPAAVGRRACAGLDTVVLRVPNHPVALALLRELGPDVPVAAPSANASGRPSPTRAAHVLQDIGAGGLIGGVVDGGDLHCAVGIESTIVDCSEPGRISILRPGGVTREQIEACVGCKVESGAHAKGDGGGPRAPGMKYRHYAPNADLKIVTGSAEDVAEQIKLAISRQNGAQNSVGVMAPDSTLAAVHGLLGGEGEGVVYVKCGRSVEDLESWGQDLYGALRAFDEHGSVKVIVAQGVREEGLGAAVMNRMLKAASSKGDVAPASSE